MATYYIDPENGSNSNDGLTENTPKLTLPTPTSNNTYLFKRGTTYLASIVVPPSVINTIIGAYGVGPRPIIKPGRSDRWSVRVQVNCTNTRIQDLECTGAAGNGAQTCHGIYIGSAPGSTSNTVFVDNCFIHNVIGNPAGDCNGITGFGDNIAITNCRITEIPDDGVWVEGKHTRVVGCYIGNVGTDSSASGDCIQLNGETVSSSAGNFYIVSNYLNHSANLEKQCFIVSSASLGYGGYVQNNVCVFPVAESNTSGNACLYSDQPGCVFIGNTTYGGTYGILIDAGAGQKIVGNLVLNAFYGITTANNPTGLLIDNNTIANCLYGGAYINNNDSTAYIRNNVFFNCARGLASHTSINKQRNAYYQNTVSNWTTTSAGGSIDADAILTDPQLSSVFTPSSSSPLINTGVYISNFRDRNGVDRGVTPSIGAYETPTVRGAR